MTTTDDSFTLLFPARAGFLRLCRLNATTFAADQGFDVDELDDLRLAVSESVSWLLSDEDSGGEVELRLAVLDQQVSVSVVRTADALPERGLDDLVHAILGATVDDYEIDQAAAHRSIRLLKSRAQ